LRGLVRAVDYVIDRLLYSLHNQTAISEICLITDLILDSKKKPAANTYAERA